MKKIIIVLNLLVLTLFISGCGCSKKEEKTVVCKLKIEDINHETNSNVTIKYDENNGDMISFEEESYLISNEEEIRNEFKTLNDNRYSSYGKYYSSFIKDDKVQMNINIEFNKISVDEFLVLDGYNYGYLTDGKIDYNKIIEYYEDYEGYECN